jgi:predicted nuclease of predicted toxin-antitoxin system
MRFLIDANMPRSTAELLKRYDYEAVDVRDIGMGAAADSDIAAYAQQNRLALVTRDFDFADLRNYPPAQYAGLLVLELPDDAVVASMLRVLKSFVSQQELIEALPGRLAILEPGRVRFRPPLS